MAQSALTATPENPTPPTNLSYVGTTPPTDPAQAYVDDGITAAVPNSTTGGAANGHTLNEVAGTTYAQSSLITFAAKTAVAGTAGYTSVDAEGKGTETSSTATSGNPVALGQNKMVSCGPVYNTQALRDAGPNANHASYMSNAVTPTITGLSAGGTSGAGTTLLTVTGTNYTRQSIVNVNGVPQITNYTSGTVLTVTNAPKKATAGNVPVTVTSFEDGGITTAPTNWVFT